MDVDSYAAILVKSNRSQADISQYNQARGARSSLMEHLVPEIALSQDNDVVNSISAVKALVLAAEQGQKIIYIDSKNVNEQLSGLNHTPDVRQDILASVNSGKIVTIHESSIQYGKWYGGGYIITDPLTGSGAYKISGGNNGSESIDGIAESLGKMEFFSELIGRVLKSKFIYSLASFFGPVATVLGTIAELGDVLARCSDDDLGNRMMAVMSVLAITFAIMLTVGAIGFAFPGAGNLIAFILMSAISRTIEVFVGKIKEDIVNSQCGSA